MREESKRQVWVLVCALLSGCSHTEETAPKAVVAVKTARVKVEDVQLSVAAPATLFPREQASIAARITAPIRELKARKGDSVKAGQVLAVLENRDVVAQREEAAAALADAQATLQKTSAGTLPTDVEHARGQLASAEAALNQAQKIYDRRSELFKQGAIPGRDLLVSETDLAKAKTDQEVAKRSLELLQTQSGEKDIAIARARVDQAKARLEQANAQLAYTELRSPFAGAITDQFQYPGDMAQPGTPAFTVMDLSVVTARAQAPETQIAGLRLGQSCSFQPADASEAARGGHVTVINKAVDPARRTVEVWCEIPNGAHALRGGVFGQAAFATGKIPNSMVVPLAAVQFKEGTRSGTVMVVDAKNIAHQREIEAGETAGDSVRILKGLKSDEVVITEGSYSLPDGAEVKITADAPAESPEPAKPAEPAKPPEKAK